MALRADQFDRAGKAVGEAGLDTAVGKMMHGALPRYATGIGAALPGTITAEPVNRPFCE
jgi:hypothetical protein